MPRAITLVIGLIAALLCGSLLAAKSPSTIQSVNRIPLSFTKNLGQWDDRVLFRANAYGATMWFTKEGVTYQFTRNVGGGTRRLPESLTTFGRALDSSWSHILRSHKPDDRDSVEHLVITAKFLGANANPEIVTEGETDYKCNYFLGNDPSKWRTDVPSFEAITLRDIYPGIDLKYFGDGTGQTTCEFVTTAGADLALIKVEYEGAEGTSLDADGRRVLKTKWGDMVGLIESPMSGVLSGTGSFLRPSGKTIALEADGASRQALSTFSVVMSYSTYLGRGSDDWGYSIAIDGSGNAYVTGRTSSANFPTQNPYQTDQSGEDVFVTKLSNSGNSLVYSTYLGGEYNDYGVSIAVDVSGHAYVTGYTISIDFPASNPYQTGQADYDAFVTKLSSTGDSLIYSTRLGGGSDDWGSGIAVDGSGNAYVTGATESTNFPTLSPSQTTFQGGYCDAFVTELSGSGNSLIYSTYLGGEDTDYGQGIAVDGSGNAYVTGETWSSNFPTVSPYQSTFQGSDEYYGGDAFVTKLSSSGNGLIYSTYLGGADGDGGFGIAVDGGGNAYVTGQTRSTKFPTQTPYQAVFQGDLYDAFVTKLSSSGRNLIYSTYLGGRDGDRGCGIAIDGGGNAYVLGFTSSDRFPTQNSYQTDQGGEDAFVTKLSSSGNSLVYSTYLGGEYDDYGSSIAVDGNGNAYVTGYTISTEFPTLNPYQTNQGGADVFVTKLSPPPYLSGDANNDATVNISDAVYLIAYIFAGGPAPVSLLAGDANCSNTVNISDAVYLIAYIFSGGPAPGAGCK